MNDPEAIDETVTRLCETQDHAELSYPFGPGAAIYKIHRRIFAIITTTRSPTRLTLKCDPDLAEHLRGGAPSRTCVAWR
jgi:predicted DNA-binding protein (MmcQ/YjbR family)